ncbi:MAG: DUF1501 domain-containing protein, partial [Planctomycetota bacterium]
MLNSPLPAALLARRDLLRVGGVALASSLVPSAWLAKAAEQRGRAGRPGRAESVIFLWMAGGVTHLDSFDPKPQAPVEIRGTLGDIARQLP